MRIAVLKAKGGVGGSTIAASLAKYLALRGMRVLLIDRDLVGTVSELAGLRGNGLIQLVKEGSDPRGALASLQVGRGVLDVLKLFSDGVPVEVEREDVRNLRDGLTAAYSDLIRAGRYDFFVADNAAAATPLDPVSGWELSAFSELMPGHPRTAALVMEPGEVGLRATLRYAASLRDHGVSYFGIVIANKVEVDMGSLKSAHDSVNEVMNDTGARIGALVPFLQELRRLPESIEMLHVPTQVMEVGNAILRYMQWREIRLPMPDDQLRELVRASGAARERGSYVYTPGPDDPLKRVVLTLSSALVKLQSSQFAALAKRLIDIVRDEHGDEAQAFALDPEGKISIPGLRKLTLMPAYSSDRLRLKGIEDAVKMARRLAQDALDSSGRGSGIPSLLIVSSTNSLEPVSTCCDQSLLSREFWREFLAHLRSSNPSMIAVLLCEPIGDRCDALDGLADFTISGAQAIGSASFSIVSSRIP